MVAEDARGGCAETLQQLDYERYLACLFSQPNDRQELLALYALNAELGRVRENVSEAMLGHIRFTWWREAIEALSQGEVRAHPVIQALAPTIETGRYSADALIDMIDARIADLYEDGPADQAAFQDYAERTGGTVMQQAMLTVQPYTGTQAQRIGLAMTQGGVVRSIAFHASMRRLHLPADALAQMGLSADDIFQGRFTPGIAELAQRMGEEALYMLENGLGEAWSKRARRVLVPAVFSLVDLRAAQTVGFNPEKPLQTPPRAIKLLKSWWFIQTGRI